MKNLTKNEVDSVNGGLVGMVVFSAAVIGIAIIHKYTK